MTTEVELRRSGLLPNPFGSRAVLIGCDEPTFRQTRTQPTTGVAALGEALIAAASGMAFHPSTVAVISRQNSPAEVYPAVVRAAREASDVLLVHYAGADRPSLLKRIAEVVWASKAARRVVLLDSPHAHSALDWFAHDPRPDGEGPSYALTVLGSSPVYMRWAERWDPAFDQLTPTLAEALQRGVDDAPKVLDLATLHDAVEGEWTQLRYRVEDEHMPGVSRLVLIGGEHVALGLNIAAGPGTRNELGPMSRDARAVHLAEGMWDESPPRAAPAAPLNFDGRASGIVVPRSID